MSDSPDLLAEYAAVAAARARRITILVQEVDALTAKARAGSGRAQGDKDRIAELEREVASLRRRLRRAEASRDRVLRHPVVRVGRRATRLVRGLRPGSSGP
jgi:transcription elongation GreA/GreB family factor